MNKKLLLFLLTFTMIMFVGINAKAGCPAGQGADSSATTGCSACAAGSVSPADNDTCTSCNESTTDKKPNSTKSSCYCPSISISVTDGCTGTYSKNSGNICGGTSGSSCTISATASGGTITKTVTSDPSGYVSVSDEGVVSVTGTPSGKDCKKTITVTWKATNKCNSTGETASGSITVMTPWGGGSAGRCYNGVCHDRCAAEAANESKAYEGCVAVAGASYKNCSAVYSRGCGKKDPTPACYKDGDGFLRWGIFTEIKETNDEYKEVLKDAYKGYTLVPGIKREEDCYTQFRCSEMGPSAETVTTACNGTHIPEKEATKGSNGELTGIYTKQCGIYDGTTIGSEFYKITCIETMKTSFEGPIFSNEKTSTSFMYPGTGFGFNYYAKTKIECEGKWDSSFESKAQNYVTTYLSGKSFEGTTFHGDTITSNDWIKKAQSGIDAYRNSYKNWKVDYYSKGKPYGTIEDSQPSGVVSIKDEHKFNLELEILSDEAEECGTKLPTGNLNPINHKETHNIVMKLPTLWYDKNAKYENKDNNQYKVRNCKPGSNDPNCLGRIFPVSDSKEFAGKDNYTYTVSVHGLGMKSNWNNMETCPIVMRTKEVYFRSINVNDPFIKDLKSGHKIGLNWKNNKFDFTGLIHSNIWTQEPQYNMIRITEEDGRNIKAEINTNTGYYTGICSTGSASTASTICSKYNQAMKGKK